jgi:hypothetical protein
MILASKINLPRSQIPESTKIYSKILICAFPNLMTWLCKMKKWMTLIMATMMTLTRTSINKQTIRRRPNLHRLLAMLQQVVVVLWRYQYRSSLASRNKLKIKLRMLPSQVNQIINQWLINKIQQLNLWFSKRVRLKAVSQWINLKNSRLA